MRKRIQCHPAEIAGSRVAVFIGNISMRKLMERESNKHRRKCIEYAFKDGTNALSAEYRA